MTENNKARTLVVERVFEAPVERVWAAWTDPAQVSKWWGPKNFTSPDNKIDFRVGGTYVFCMQTPDGQKMYSGGTYKEIVPHQKIVLTDSFMDAGGNIVSGEHYGMPADFPAELLVTLTFEAQDGNTKLTLRHEGIPAGQMADQTEAGWNESLDKLAASLT